MQYSYQQPQKVEDYKKGVKIWLPDSEEVWISAVVVEDFVPEKKYIRVQPEDGDEVSMPVISPDHLPFLCNPEFLIDTNDLATLSYLNEPDVLYTLKYRFELGRIYTYCGIALVAINPYKDLDLYHDKYFCHFRGRNVRQLDPHIYSLAEEAFASLVQSEKNQSVVITGESGSGKTVSAKHVMRYLAHACSSVIRSRCNHNDVENKVLASNPILEAFGNAATIRNDNSSRFGKFVQIAFADEYFITGAFIETYLLERSRVVYQAEDERNYHIFYQLCAARDSEPLLEKLDLGPATNFHYLNQGGKACDFAADDLKIYKETREAFLRLGFDKETLRQIYTVLAAILHLGNVAFVEAAEASDVAKVSAQSVKSLTVCAGLLMVNEDKLHHWLCNRLIRAGTEGEHIEELTKGLTVEETWPDYAGMYRDAVSRHYTTLKKISDHGTGSAKSARNATAKHIYASLFHWIVQRINKSLTTETNRSTRRNIGILDIYGFEIFEENSFEQLCVNYANEILQQQFNQHVFKLEQEEYVREGLEWSFISFVDNQPCLDLLEGRLGIFDLLDQECRLTTCNDDNWLNIMLNSKICTRSKYFSFPLVRSKEKNFVIHHYASPVSYQVNGFTAKNLDTVNPEHISLLKASKLPMIGQILIEEEGAKVRPKSGMLKQKSRNLKQTVALQFRQSLRDLKKILDSTMPHYVRCVKPNEGKLPLTFQIRRASEQLNACGVLETIRISAAGYPSRWLYDDFKNRYNILLPSVKKSWKMDSREFTQLVCTTLLESDQYIFGKTKVFFRVGQVAFIETQRSTKLFKSAVTIQKVYRGYCVRQRYRQMRNAVYTIQIYCKAWLVWRWCKYIQMHRAALVISSFMKCCFARKRYLKLRRVVVTIQRLSRIKLAWQKFLQDTEYRCAVTIQKYVRRFLARKRFRRFKTAAVTIQCAVRCWIARKKLKELKVEARSVGHLQNLNKGLEKKIMTIQEKMDLMTEENNELKQHVALLIQQNDVTKATSDNLLSELQKRIEQQNQTLKCKEEEISCLKEKLSTITPVIVTDKCDVSTATETVAKSDRCEGTSFEEADVLNSAELEIFVGSGKGNNALLQALCESKKSGAISPILFSEMCATMIRLLDERSLLQNQLDKADMQLKLDQLHSHNEVEMQYKLKIQELEAKCEQQERQTRVLMSQVSSGKFDFKSILHSQQVQIARLMEENMAIKSVMTNRFGRSEEAIFTAFHEQKDLIRELHKEFQSKSSDLEKALLQVEILRQETLDRGRPKANAKASEKPPDEDSKILSVLVLLSVKNLILQKALEESADRIETLNQCFESENSLRLSEHRKRLDSTLDSSTKYLGILEVLDIEKFITLLITDITPDMLEGLTPRLPACLVIMALLYYDYVEDAIQLNHLVHFVFSEIRRKFTEKEAETNMDLLLLWLSNVCCLYELMQQRNGESAPASTNAQATEEQTFRHYELGEIRQLFREMASEIYRNLLTVCIWPHLFSLIVPGILEAEYSTGRKKGKSGVNPLDSLIEYLQHIVSKARAYEISEDVAKQAFQAIATYMCSNCLNELMMRKDLCNFSRAVQIKHNITILSQWMQNYNFLTDLPSVFDPLIQATHLLQSRKTVADIPDISELCSKLTIAQIENILHHYSPQENYEEKISLEFFQSLKRELLRVRCPTDLRSSFRLTMEDTALRELRLGATTKFRVDLTEVMIPSWLNDYVRKL